TKRLANGRVRARLNTCEFLDLQISGFAPWLATTSHQYVTNLTDTTRSFVSHGYVSFLRGAGPLTVCPPETRAVNVGPFSNSFVGGDSYFGPGRSRSERS